jgi:hypothetical protein
MHNVKKIALIIDCRMINLINRGRAVNRGRAGLFSSQSKHYAQHVATAQHLIDLILHGIALP